MGWCAATTVAGGPDAPTDLTPTAHDNNQRTGLSWTAPMGTITGYWVEWTTDGGDDASWAVRQTNRRDSPYVETGLAPLTQYCYRVAAVTRNGAVPYIGPYAIDCYLTPQPGN